MSASITVGDRVKWNWGNGEGEGEVVKRYTRRITLAIEGSEITRDASEDEPAFRIEQTDGAEVLKSVTELKKA